METFAEPFFVYPHLDLYRHAINRLVELAALPGNEDFIPEAQEFLEKLSKVRRESIDILENIISTLKSEIREIEDHLSNDQLDGIVDAVYVLLLEGTDRKKNVYRQLEQYKPGRLNHVQFNKGFKKCRNIWCHN